MEDLITAVGALIELLGLMRKQLVENGFTRQEAYKMCEAYLIKTLNQKFEEEK